MQRQYDLDAGSPYGIRMILLAMAFRGVCMVLSTSSSCFTPGALQVETIPVEFSWLGKCPSRQF